ncbi:hypothetical protein D187_010243 [Cystobacter fuscus DSM 2262]|uniref:Uncharacterized protein n=1 Tax=Cystobacter fuscus (strain ATCC 25194 / DSM 2262 / NBRC 100088 / M29) TaxID=1242864 RepID=S9QK50_CYSF2|nr:hypothetical protein [Cystobacter fuscus]EPX61624.1 hypothetical protein D187_010243 [Cystobacter fuscus DSM 2262]
MNPTAYTVEIDPSAWSQLALLRGDTYRRVREALTNVASTVTPAEVACQAGSPLVVDGTVAHYDVDHLRRRVLLREVAPSTQEA